MHMMLNHVFAVLRNKNIKIRCLFTFKNSTRLLFSCQQSSKVLLHFCQIFDELETGLLEIAKFFQKVAIFDCLGNLRGLIQMRLFIVLELFEE